MRPAAQRLRQQLDAAQAHQLAASQALTQRAVDATHYCPSARAKIRPDDCRARQLRDLGYVGRSVCAKCPSPVEVGPDELRAAAQTPEQLSRALARMEERMAENTPKRRSARRWTNAQRRQMVEGYEALPRTGGERTTYLDQHGISSGCMSRWRQRFGAPKADPRDERIAELASAVERLRAERDDMRAKLDKQQPAANDRISITVEGESGALVAAIARLAERLSVDEEVEP